MCLRVSVNAEDASAFGGTHHPQNVVCALVSVSVYECVGARVRARLQVCA